MPDNCRRALLSSDVKEANDSAANLSLRGGNLDQSVTNKGDVKDGRDGVVKLMLRRKDLGPDIPDNSGETPLSWAATFGHDEVVKVLLGYRELRGNSMLKMLSVVGNRQQS